MIFNPFDIKSIEDALQQTATLLPWAPVQLQDNILLVLLVILFALADMLACHPQGVVMHQLQWLANTRNVRTFEASSVVYPWLKPLLLCQYFLFFGLCMFHIVDPQMAEHLTSPSEDLLYTLLLCFSIPLGWFLLQHFLFHWFCYLFSIHGKQIILNRCYLAIHIVVAPLITIIFMSVLAGAHEPQMTFILLATLFILTQIVFIFYGFKIFCTNFYTFCLIIVYLCTLEIAPLLVFFARFAK